MEVWPWILTVLAASSLLVAVFLSLRALRSRRRVTESPEIRGSPPGISASEVRGPKTSAGYDFGQTAQGDAWPSMRAIDGPTVLAGDSPAIDPEFGVTIDGDADSGDVPRASDDQAGLLYWNTWSESLGFFPDLLEIRVGHIHSLSTQITQRGFGSRVQAFSADALRDQMVRFELFGDGVTVALTADGPFSTQLSSPMYTCTTEGTPSFEFRWRADRTGPVSMTAAMTVARTVMGEFTLRFTGTEPDPLPVVVPPTNATMEVLVYDASAWAEAPVTDAVLQVVQERHEGVELLRLSHDPVVDGAAAPFAADDLETLRATVRSVRLELEKLARSYAPTSCDFVSSDESALRTVANLGRTLHRCLFGFPGEGSHQLDAIAHHLRHAPDGYLLGIDDRSLGIPWGILYDRPLSSDEEVELKGFWGARFRWYRRAVTEQNIVSQGSGVKMALPQPDAMPAIHSFLNPQLENPVFAHQDLWENGLTQRAAVAFRGRSAADLLQWAHHPSTWNSCRLMYVNAHCHFAGTTTEAGFPTATDPDSATSLELDSGASGRVSVLNLREARLDERGHHVPMPDRPVAFINACRSGAADANGLVNPLAKLMVGRWQFPGFIGTEWSAPQYFAAPFGSALVDELLTGATLVDALWTTTNKVLNSSRDPQALNYYLLGRPDARIAREDTADDA